MRLCVCKIGSCKKRLTIARKKAAVKADVIITIESIRQLNYITVIMV